MEETLRNVIEQLLEKIAMLKTEKKELVSRCQENCRLCRRMDCDHRKPACVRSGNGPLRLLVK